MRTYIANVQGRWYAFRADISLNRVLAIGNDRPLDASKQYAGSLTASGVRFASLPCPTRSAAYQKARRNGEYAGELHFPEVA